MAAPGGGGPDLGRHDRGCGPPAIRLRPPQGPDRRARAQADLLACRSRPGGTKGSRAAAMINRLGGITITAAGPRRGGAVAGHRSGHEGWSTASSGRRWPGARRRRPRVPQGRGRPAEVRPGPAAGPAAAAVLDAVPSDGHPRPGAARRGRLDGRGRAGRGPLRREGRRPMAAGCGVRPGDAPAPRRSWSACGSATPARCCRRSSRPCRCWPR